MLGWDSDNIESVLSPHKRKLMEVIELRKKEGSSLLLLCIAVLGAESTTNPCMRL